MSEGEGSSITGWRKAVLVTLALLPVGVLVFSMVAMQQNEAAFDEATCPYEEVEVREVADGVRIREEGRACQEGVAEHRWVLLRDGEEPEPIGLRRLDAELFRDYRWEARVRDDDRVQLEIHNGELDPRRFIEPHDDAGAR